MENAGKQHSQFKVRSTLRSIIYFDKIDLAKTVYKIKSKWSKWSENFVEVQKGAAAKVWRASPLLILLSCLLPFLRRGERATRGQPDPDKLHSTGKERRKRRRRRRLVFVRCCCRRRPSVGRLFPLFPSPLFCSFPSSSFFFLCCHIQNLGVRECRRGASVGGV